MSAFRKYVAGAILLLGLQTAAMPVRADLLTYGFSGTISQAQHSGVQTGESFAGTLIYDTEAPFKFAVPNPIDTRYLDPLGSLTVTLSGGLTVSSSGPLELAVKDFPLNNRSDFLPFAPTINSNSAETITTFMLFLVKLPGGGNLFPDVNGGNALPDPQDLGALFNTRSLIIDVGIDRVSGYIQTLTLESRVSTAIAAPPMFDLFVLALVAMALGLRYSSNTALAMMPRWISFEPP